VRKCEQRLEKPAARTLRAASKAAHAYAAMLSTTAFLATSPAAAQFVCTITPTDVTCTNSGTQNTSFPSTATGANQNDTVSNSGTANGFLSETSGGGNSTANNSGTNTGIAAATVGGGNAAATNSGTNTGIIEVVTENGGNATATNSGSNTGDILVETSGANSPPR
jgi:hypothetical protein